MNPRTVRGAAAAVGVAAALLTPADRVDAEAVQHEDARGDVVRVDATTGRAAPAPDQANGDITGVRLGHAAMVSAVVRFDDLRRAGLDVLQVATDEGLRRTVTLTSEPGHWAGTSDTGARLSTRIPGHGADSAARPG